MTLQHCENYFNKKWFITEMKLDFKTCKFGKRGKHNFISKTMKIIQIWFFIIFFLLSINWLYNIHYICITLLTHWRIQRIGTSKIFCQNRAEIAHTASLSLKPKILVDSSLPLWKSNSVVEPHFEMHGSAPVMCLN
jgi:hypothetical protein